MNRHRIITRTQRRSIVLPAAACFLCLGLTHGGAAWGATLQCDPISDLSTQLRFAPSIGGEDVTAVLPLAFGTATLVGLSMTYGEPAQVVVPINLWRGADDTVEGHFEVKANHARFALDAIYADGDCYRHSIKTVESWDARRPQAGVPGG